jgi:hypothetical protein
MRHLDHLLSDLAARAEQLRAALHMPASPAYEQLRAGRVVKLMQSMQALAAAVECDRAQEVAGLLARSLKLLARLRHQRERLALRHQAHEAALDAADH